MYEVYLTKAAENDLQNAALYIADTLMNKAAANRFLDAVTDEITSISEYPFRNTLVSDSILAANGIRFQLVGKYLVFYVVREQANSVRIIRILHTRRDWITILRNDNT